MESSERTIGSLEITGFEIGDQRIPGQTENEEGYTKLSGNFHFEMYPTVGGADSDKLKITEGKFDLSARSEEHTYELQSLMRSSYAVLCSKKKNKKNNAITA